MKPSTIELLISGMLLLFLSACAPYPHNYYPAGGAYSGYSATQRSYFGGYPYRYDKHSDPYNSNYRYDHNGYNSRPSWNNGYVRPNPSNEYSHKHPDRKHQQFDYQGSVPAYPDHKDRHNLHDNNNWSKHQSDRQWEHNNPQHSWPNSDGQNHGQHQRPDARGNQIKEQRHYEHENNNRGR